MFRRRQRYVLFSIILIGVGNFLFTLKNIWTDQSPKNNKCVTEKMDFLVTRITNTKSLTSKHDNIESLKNIQSPKNNKSVTEKMDLLVTRITNTKSLTSKHDNIESLKNIQSPKNNKSVTKKMDLLVTRITNTKSLTSKHDNIESLKNIQSPKNNKSVTQKMDLLVTRITNTKSLTSKHDNIESLKNIQSPKNNKSVTEKMDLLVTRITNTKSLTSKHDNIESLKNIQSPKNNKSVTEKMDFLVTRITNTKSLTSKHDNIESLKNIQSPKNNKSVTKKMDLLVTRITNTKSLTSKHDNIESLKNIQSPKNNKSVTKKMDLLVTRITNTKSLTSKHDNIESLKNIQSPKNNKSVTKKMDLLVTRITNTKSLTSKHDNIESLKNIQSPKNNKSVTKKMDLLVTRITNTKSLTSKHDNIESLKNIQSPKNNKSVTEKMDLLVTRITNTKSLTSKHDNIESLKNIQSPKNNKSVTEKMDFLVTRITNTRSLTSKHDNIESLKNIQSPKNNKSVTEKMDLLVTRITNTKSLTSKHHNIESLKNIQSPKNNKSVTKKMDLLVTRITNTKSLTSKHDSGESKYNILEHENFTAFHGLPQKCKIPVLDPYHPDVKPFYKTWSVPDCDYPQLSEVTDEGYLQIRGNNTETITEAKYAYIQRVNDDRQIYSQWQVFYKKNNTTTATNEAIKLTEDFVKVLITTPGGVSFEEYHMYPVRKEQGGEATLDRDANQLNMIFIMIDSVSHSTAERYLKKTLKKMKASKSTIIMNGHTIVGDGTTPQIVAMFVGNFEHQLPEARKGYPKSGNLDRWPFIFQEFEEMNYTTLYSEDSPGVNTFNYRLHGFDKPPTTKYMRNFWRSADPYILKLDRKSIKCSHQINFRYLKRFMRVYHDKPTFSYLVVSELTHNHSPAVQHIDDDLVDLLDHFKSTGQDQNTLLVIFGDHGDRNGPYRATMTGKLEERLPFMSFTFPPWFPEKYPNEFANFQRNSQILTSHFDVYSTLQHLKYFPQNKYEHKYGTSLFTDITHLNRTCPQIGILDHWCSCLHYQELKVNDALVIKAAQTVVAHINAINAKVEVGKELCAELKLDKVIRAGIIAPSARVQKFAQTFKDGQCDECGVKEGETNYKTTNYEVIITVLPSGGRYESTAVFHKDSGVFTPNEGVSRINLYKQQPHCIQKQNPYLRPYCYCKQQLDS